MQDEVSILGERLARRLGAPDPFIALKRACSRLLDESMQHGTPVRLKSVLEHLGVPIIYESAVGREEAALRLIDGRINLAISRGRLKSAPRRARFTIAHEIGHLILYNALGAEVFDAVDEDAAAYKEVERYCDFAASHLLLPRERLSAALRINGLSQNGMRRLAVGFDVSHEALLRALPDLVADGQVVEWRTYRRHDGEEMTWRVWGCYAPYRRAGPQPWMPKGSTMKHLDLTELIPDLKAGEILMKSPTDLVLGTRRSRHDIVACLWPAHVQNVDLALEAGEATTGRERDAMEPGRLMVVLARVGSVDPGLFGARVR